MTYNELIILESIKPELNINELRLFEYKIMCYESTQIAFEMGISITTYYKRCKRVREKILNIMSKND